MTLSSASPEHACKKLLWGTKSRRMKVFHQLAFTSGGRRYFRQFGGGLIINFSC